MTAPGTVGIEMQVAFGASGLGVRRGAPAGPGGAGREFTGLPPRAFDGRRFAARGVGAEGRGSVEAVEIGKGRLGLARGGDELCAAIARGIVIRKFTSDVERAEHGALTAEDRDSPGDRESGQNHATVTLLSR